MFVDLLRERRDRIIAAAREHALRSAPARFADDIDDGLSMFLDHLVGTLGQADHRRDMAQAATLHGGRLFERGYTIAQVVHAYGALCQAITDVAAGSTTQISAAEFGSFNRILDDAIAHAVTEYARARDARASDQETERLGCMAHELRNFLNSGRLAFEVIKTGRVGAGGSTGAVLARSLAGIGSLIDRTLSEVRLEAGLARPERVDVSELVEDVEVGAALEAAGKGVHLRVVTAEGLIVDADRQLLASAMTNLLQNAVKFTSAAGSVSLHARRSGRRALIDVADACGGLPPGRSERLFAPYAQGGADRSGLGLGLTIVRRAIAACGGEVRVADVPGQGCVFTIDLALADPA